jgi:ATP-dependent protease ClpP protease subunit
MSRIEIRGVITSSNFDNEFWQDEMAKGIITPESKLRRDLEAASALEPLEVYINSLGGSVFSGHEMLNDIVDWRERTHQEVNVIVGSISASAASAIAVMLGPVTAHANSEFMFHSAQSFAEGGPGAMADTMTLLDQINAQVAQKLVGKYSADMDAVAEWFSEGRMGWLNVEEAMGIGLVKKIIATDGPAVDFGDMDFQSMEDPGAFKIAAMIETDQFTTNKERYEMTLLERIAQKLGITAEGEETTETAETEEATAEATEETTEENEETATEETAEQPEQTEETEESTEAETSAEVNAAYEEGYDAGKAESSGEEIAELNKVIDSLKAKLATVEQSERVAQKRLKAAQSGFTASAEDATDDTEDDFWSLVEEKVAAGVTKQQATLTAQREYPAAYQAMLKAANKK